MAYDTAVSYVLAERKNGNKSKAVDPIPSTITDLLWHQHMRGLDQPISAGPSQTHSLKRITIKVSGSPCQFVGSRHELFVSAYFDFTYMILSTANGLHKPHSPSSTQTSCTPSRQQTPHLAQHSPSIPRTLPWLPKPPGALAAPTGPCRSSPSAWPAPAPPPWPPPTASSATRTCTTG